MTSRPAAGSNEVDKNHFQEHEFAVDVDLRATPHQVTIIQLEPPESSLNPLSDTGIPGVDVIPYVFDETARRTFTVENKQGAAHTLLFLTPAGIGSCALRFIDIGKQVALQHVRGTERKPAVVHRLKDHVGIFI